MPPSAGACQTTDAEARPDCGRAGRRSSIMTAIGWRAAIASVTMRPVSGAGTRTGVGSGVGVGTGVGDGVAVGDGRRRRDGGRGRGRSGRGRGGLGDRGRAGAWRRGWRGSSRRGRPRSPMWRPRRPHRPWHSVSTPSLLRARAPRPFDRTGWSIRCVAWRRIPEDRPNGVRRARSPVMAVRRPAR